MSGLVVVGDSLLDREITGAVDRTCPDAPVPVVAVQEEWSRPGGAALVALLAARQGDVTLVTALADDAAGVELRAALERAGVEVRSMRAHGVTAEKVRVSSGGHVIVRFDRGPTPGAIDALSPDDAALLRDADVVLASDYGRGMLAHADVRAALGGRRRGIGVWDPHPRGAAPVPGRWWATPNAREARGLANGHGDDARASAAHGRALLERWPIDGVVVTLDARGALLVARGQAPLYVPAIAARGDACGAGDRFAGALAWALARGSLPSEAVESAVAAAADFVAAGGVRALTASTAATVPLVATPSDAFALARQVRDAGGVCVATGGCFDLLHAGHVAMLEAARRLGDRLIVCLNSDASVRRLKGPDRPRQRAEDRAEVLAALSCVDAVVTFDEDTPVDLLRRLRPAVFAKGADYRVEELPESAVLAEWGGIAVTLPYLAGRSTTRLLTEAADA